MTNSSAQAVQDVLESGTPASTSAPKKTKPHPPPAHNNQHYNVRIRQNQGAGGRTTSPSIRQSWFFPAHRASPSTAMAETTSVMTLNQRPRNIRSDASSATPASSVMLSSVPPSAAMNHKERKNFSGSARSRLSKIKMMNNPNTTVLSPIEGPSAPPRRMRLSLQPQANPLTEPSASMETPVTASDTAARPEVLPATAVSITPSATVNSPQHQQFMASHTSSSTPTYPRHIIMRSTSPHRTIEDHLDNDPTTDSFSSSLPSTSAFAAGIDHSQLDGPISTSGSERANRHASMPLPKPGWRLHDLPDVEESDTYYDHGEGSGFGPNGNGEEKNSFQYSASNASSTINFENHPYHPYAHAHTRQDSSSTFYTMTPSASNLDLSMASSHTNLSSLDPSAAPSADGNPIVSPGAQHTYQGPSHNPSSLSLSPPIHKVVKNSAKSPLALRRSSTMSSSTSSSPSNTFLSKGSFPKSSLSAIASYPTKTLTLERQKIILEILRTERSYVDGLVILQTLFYEPLNAPYASGNNLGMGTTTSMYSNHHNSQLLQHHQHQPVNNDNNKQTNANTGGSAGSTMHSTMPTSPSYYASSTIGSNSTLSASAAPLLSKKSVPEIFSTFVGILKINTLLLTQLETRICGSTFSTGWESDEDEIQEGDNHPKEGDEEDQQSSSQGQQANQAPKQVLVTVGSQGGETEQLLVLDADWCVGDIFSEIAPFLKMYSSYVKSYTSALAHINECIIRNERFAEFLKTTARRPECKNLDFQAYLMLPVQRIPRYRMLLGNLLQHTPVDHPDHRKLQTAFESMEQTATIVNENIRQHEMFGEMVDLQSKINGLSEPLVAPGRSLLKHGSVWKICRRNVQLRVIILLSDCILWMSPSINPLDDTLTFHRKVGLENCTVIGAEDPDPTKNAFQIISPEKSSQVYVDTPKEKEAWMVAIRRATQEYLSAKRTLKISITPMQSISAAATSFGAGLLRRETGLWSPTTFGGESRANLFAAHVAMDADMASGPGTARTSLDGGYHFTPAANAAMASGASAGGLAQRHQPQPLRVVENYNAPVWVPDQSATRCMICSEEFGTIFRRKHHCRACGKVVCHSCSTRTILIKGTHSEKVGRACDDCIDTMFPEDTNMIPPTDFDAGASTEVSPVDAQQIASDPDVDRRASNNSMDGIMIRPEDYSQESTGQSATGATGMVRGLVEAGLNRMKSRSGPGFIQDTNKNTSNGPVGDINPRENVRASNRKSDSHSLSNAAAEHQNATQVKECGLCKAEFSMFKWRNICSQCRRVVCSDCLTKKQIDQLFLMGLEAEREAKARGDAENVDANLDMVSSPDTLSPIDALNQQDQTRPDLQQSVSDSAIVASGTDVDSMAPLEIQRSPSNDQDNGPSGGGWHPIKSNTDSGHGHAEKLCDPCYLGLSADQIKVLESGGGWQYYQATMSKHQIQNIVAALALDQLDLEDKDREDNGTQGSGEINLTPESTGAEATLVRTG
ncbi:hypothetical protein BG011_005667 [Mortierella polycephala]|uniref:Uncharacterized protein n=1 Tax=Mortierella polycephala TaxID=41804 RepID=A0A9P6PVE9_9FUNG|nr:hypothetical protein BG011_005667 [Mortierella polycephala]